jgi:hypothetical protein
MKLGPNGTDPEDCKLRADEGLGAIGELSPGNIFSPATSVFNPIIKMLAEDLGYDGKLHIDINIYPILFQFISCFIYLLIYSQLILSLEHPVSITSRTFFLQN